MARRSDERDAARAEYIARMEKDGEVNLRQLADDLHLKYDTIRRWYGKMDGKYFVDQMEHTISPSNGYKTQVKASKVEKEDFA